MSAQWLPLLILIPLVGAVLTPIVGYGRPRLAGIWAFGVISAVSLVGAGLILRVAQSGPFSYDMGGWEPPWGIELRFDEFSASVGVLCLIGWLAILFSQRYVEEAIPEERIAHYYGLILLNLTGMIGFAVTGDLFNLFVFMEILSLSSYALVAIGGQGVADMAAFRYLLMGAVSSLVVLFAIGILYAMTGTLNMVDLGQRLAEVEVLGPANVALAALALGFSVKAALFPLHVWLPEAHSIAPSPVSAILSGLVVKIGVLGMLRVYQIYYQAPGIDITRLNEVLTWLGAISIVMGAFFAMTQEDIKTMLAYSTISNIGYIFMGLGLSSTFGLIGGVVHIFNHALIKATLFLGAGSIIYRTGLRNLSDLKGVGRTMPVTCAAIAIGAVSIVGLPPTAGFICKWYIALGAMEANKPLFAAVLVFGALLIFVYYIRMVNAFYFQAPVHEAVIHAHESPLTMMIPILILAALCLVMGVFARAPLSFIEPAVQRLLAGTVGAEMVVTDIRPLLAPLVSLLCAGLVFAAGAVPFWRRFWSLAAALTKLAIVLSMLPGAMDGIVYEYRLVEFTSGIGLAFRADALGMFFALVSSTLWLFTIVYAIGYMEPEHSKVRFFGFFALCVSTTVGLAFSENLLTLLLFYEMLTICTYPLVIHEETREAMRAGRKYLVYTLMGGAFVMLATTLTFHYAGTLTLSQPGILSLETGAPALTALFICFMIGFGVKSAIMPLHGWLPSAMVAPTPVSALLHAVAVVKAGVFGILRVVYNVFGVDVLSELGLGHWLAAIAGFTIITASVIALLQDNFKRRLAYSTISQLSYIVLGAALLTPYAALAAIVHIANQAFSKITMFFVAGAIQRTTGKTSIREMAGIGRQMPYTMTAFAIAALSFIGVPLFAGFITKWYLSLGALDAGQWVYVVILIVSAFLNAGYWLPVVYTAFFKPSPEGTRVKEAHWTLLVPTLVCAVYVILLGSFAEVKGLPLSLAEAAVQFVFGIPMGR